MSLHFPPGSGEFVALTSDGVLHRWDLTPAAQAFAELESLSARLNGGVGLGQR